jgi:hypothetical protein
VWFLSKSPAGRTASAPPSRAPSPVNCPPIP